MAYNPAMTTPYRKISVRIWTPLLEAFNSRVEAACLRRDVWLAKVLDEELSHLDAEVTEANSDAAQRFIGTHLDTVPRKLVTLTLPEVLVKRLDAFCDEKRVVRDSFLNRLFYLLCAEHKHITRLYFDGDDQWVQDLLGATFFSSEAAGYLLDPIPGYRNPFETIREGLWVARDRLAKESATDADTWFALHRIYSLTITDARFGKGDLYGLSLYLPDTFVPGTSDYAATAALLDQL